MSIDDWIRLGPTIATLTVGLLTVLLLPVLRLSRGIRRDLEADANVLPHLPRGAQGALRQDMAERVRIVVAYSRHPNLTRTELLIALLVLAIAAFQVFSAVDLIGSSYPPVIETGFGTAIAAASQAGMLLVAMGGWRERTTQRLLYLHKHLAKAAANEYFRTAAAAYYTARAVAAIAVVVPLGVSLGCYFYVVGETDGSTVGWVFAIGSSALPVLIACAAIPVPLVDRKFDNLLAEGGPVLGLARLMRISWPEADDSGSEGPREESPQEEGPEEEGPDGEGQAGGRQ